MFSISDLVIGLSYIGAETVFLCCSKNLRRVDTGFNGPVVIIIVASPSFQTSIAIDVWKDGDATIIITTGPLKPVSTLRKFFEQHKNTVSAPIYDNPMTKSEIENIISEVGLKNITQDSFTHLSQIALQLEL